MARRVGLRLDDLDWTMDELAEKLGMSRPRVSQIIHAETITEDVWERLSEALSMTMEDWETPFPTPGPMPSIYEAQRARAKEVANRVGGV